MSVSQLWWWSFQADQKASVARLVWRTLDRYIRQDRKKSQHGFARSVTLDWLPYRHETSWRVFVTAFCRSSVHYPRFLFICRIRNFKLPKDGILRSYFTRI